MDINNSQEAFQYIESFRNFEKSAQFSSRHFRLDRMESLLDLFNHPEKDYKIFHIAGTKGKGSTALFLSNLLARAGFKTGLYTSPHVINYSERIQVQNKEADPEIITLLTKNIQKKIKDLTFKPTTFELLTLLGFLYFQICQCEYTVLETGLGGRLDATNVVNPQASIITPIDIEHTEFLGNTLESIATEKAGIIKKDKPVFSSRQHPVVKDVLLKKSLELNSPLKFVEDEISSSLLESNYEYQRCELKFLKNEKSISTKILMLGDFQRDNLALASLVFDHFFPELSQDIIPVALDTAYLPGRMEIVTSNPFILLDGAHTINSIEKLVSNAKNISPPRPRILLFGCLADKKAKEMLDLLKTEFDEIILTHPTDLRKADLSSMAEILLKENVTHFIEENTNKAIEHCLKKTQQSASLIVTGSFYLLGRFKELFTRK